MGFAGNWMRINKEEDFRRQHVGQRQGGAPEPIRQRARGPAGPATFVPAGIVAVTRAQERGYALVSLG